MATMYVGPFTFGDVSDEQAVTAIRAMLAALEAGKPYVHEFRDRGKPGRYVAITPSVPISADLDDAWPGPRSKVPDLPDRGAVGDAEALLRLGNRRFSGPLDELLSTLDAAAHAARSTAELLVLGESARWKTVVMITPSTVMHLEAPPTEDLGASAAMAS